MTTATLAGPRHVADNGERRRLDDEYLTRREADTLVKAGRSQNEAAKEAHDAVHASQLTALNTAMNVQERDRLAHNLAHEREHQLHAEKHGGEREAVRVAMDAVAREREIHAEAHAREHFAHANEHSLSNLAITKAEKATDDRFASTERLLGQNNEFVREMVTRDQFDVQVKEHDRRYEEIRTSITNLEKGDVGDRSLGRGRAIGQGVVIAAIIGIVTFIGTVLGIVIVIINIVTRTPAVVT